jgi:hypothetical protein
MGNVQFATYRDEDDRRPPLSRSTTEEKWKRDEGEHLLLSLLFCIDAYPLAEGLRRLSVVPALLRPVLTFALRPDAARAPLSAYKTWIPVPLRPWFWVPFVCLAVCLAVGLEVALSISKKRNGARRVSFSFSFADGD